MKIKSIVLTALALITLAACGGKGGGMPNFGDNEFAVRTVESSSASAETTYPATIRGIQDVEVRPKVSGFITKVLVHEGQNVKAGQVLFTLDAETFRAAVRQAQAAVNTARSQMNTARLTYENSKKLYERKIIGSYELQTAQNTFASAQAQLAQAQAALASAKEQLSYCTVTSPAAGVVGLLPMKEGTLVGPTIQQPLTTVSNISTAEVYFSMPEDEIMDMTKSSGSVNAALGSMPEVKLLLADGTVYNHPGKVVKMSGVIDAGTGSVSLIARFANPERLLKSGGAAQIIIPHQNNAAIKVPQDACAQIQDKVFVYVVGKDNKVKYTEIKVAPQNDGLTYVVTSGLNVGDRYVSKGVSKLTDGMQIKPISEEECQKKINDAAELSKKQGTAKGFVGAMQGK